MSTWRGFVRVFALTALTVAGCGPKLNPGGAGEADSPGGGIDGNTLAPTGCAPATVSYATASGVIATKCGVCHNNGQSPAMSSYAMAKAAFSTGGGLTAVDNGTMPTGMKLTAAEKCLLDNWAASAYPQ